MDPAQVAVLWTLVLMQCAQPRRQTSAKQGRLPGVSLAGRLRRFVFRGQLGPVGGHAPA